jgi:carbonic anhydrase
MNFTNINDNVIVTSHKRSQTESAMKFPVSILLTLCLVASASAVDLQTPLEAYRGRQDNATPESVLEWLKVGNQRFAAGRSEHGGYPVDAKERLVVSAQGQRPLAVVLSCIDSRTAPEVVFDVSIGDLFTTRVGANVVNDDILGSIEIAVASGAKLVVVLGHTDCGGVKGACNNLEFGHMTQLLERVKPAIAQTNARLDADPALSAEVGERVTTNRRYVAEVSHANAHASTEQIRQRSSILREQADSGAIQIVTAVFNVDTGLVTFDP